MRHLRRVSLGAATLAIVVGGVAIMGATVFLVVGAIARLHRANTVSERAQQTIAIADQIGSGTLAIALRERSFVATGDPAFLTTLGAAIRSHDRQLAALGASLDGSQPSELRLLTSSVQRFDHGWAIPQITLARHDPAAARIREDAGVGYAQTAEVSGIVRSLVRAERTVAEAEQDRASVAAAFATLIVIVGFAMTVLFPLGYLAFLRRSIVRPVRRLRDAMHGMRDGNLMSRVRSDGIGEIGEIQEGFNAMADVIVEEQGEAGTLRSNLEARRLDLESVVRDLATEREIAERLYRLADRLAAESGIQDVAGIILQQMSEVSGGDASALFAADEQDDRRFYLLAWRGLDPARLPPTLLQSSSEHTVLTKVGQGLQRELRVPLFHGSRLFGVVFLGWRSEAAKGGERLEEVLNHMGNQGALALRNNLSRARSLRLGSLNETLIESSRDGIRLIDLDGVVLAQNTRMTELVAGAAGCNPGPTFWEQAAAIGPRTTDPSRFAAMTERIAAEPGAELSFEYELAETGQVLSRLVAPVRDGAGTQTGRIVVLRDVTPERQAQRMKDDFVASVTHELRTPLTSITGYLELLLEGAAGELSDEQEQFLHVVDRNATRLLGLVNDLLFVGRLESGMLALEPVSTDLGELLAEAVEAAGPAAEAQGVTVRLSAGSIPELFADRFRVAQLVDNLLSNAVKFTPRGGRVSVSAACDLGKVVLLVADSGIGVPDDEKPRLFDRFFRASTAVEQAVPGTGLGLAITKAIAEAHGGTISVEDTPGGGTTFRVELPLVLSHSEVAA